VLAPSQQRGQLLAARAQNSWIGPFQLATQVKSPAAALGSPGSGSATAPASCGRCMAPPATAGAARAWRASAARRKVAKHFTVDTGEDDLRYAARAPIVFRVMSSSSATGFGTGSGSHGGLAEAALADADGPRFAVGSAPERSAARPEIDRSNVNCLEVRLVFTRRV